MKAIGMIGYKKSGKTSLVRKTIVGMLSSLKEYRGRNIEIKIEEK